VPNHEDLLPILTSRVNTVKDGKILEYESINNIENAFRSYLAQKILQGKENDLRTFKKIFI
jgi:hypothetical protein